MKSLLIVVSSIIIVFNLSAQNGTENLNSLNQEKKNIENQISILNVQLSEVNKKIKQYSSEPGTSTIILSSTSNGLIQATASSGGGVLRSSPSTSGKIITTVREGESLYLYKEVQNLYIKAKYYGKDGWISYLNLKSNPGIEALMNENTAKTNTKPKSQNATKIRTVDTNSPKYKRLVKIYGKNDAIKLMNNEIWKGMSHGMVRESLGQPIEQKKVNTPSGLQETWKFAKKTVIFVNGSVNRYKNN